MVLGNCSTVLNGSLCLACKWAHNRSQESEGLCCFVLLENSTQQRGGEARELTSHRCPKACGQSVPESVSLHGEEAEPPGFIFSDLVTGTHLAAILSCLV